MFVVQRVPKAFPGLSLSNLLLKFENRRKNYGIAETERSKLYSGELVQETSMAGISPPESPEADSIENLFGDDDMNIEEEDEEESTKKNKKRTRLEDLQAVGPEERDHKSTFMHQYDSVSKQLDKKLKQGGSSSGTLSSSKKKSKKRPFDDERCNNLFEQMRKDYKSGQIGLVPEYFSFSKDKFPKHFASNRSEFFLEPELVEIVDFFVKNIEK